MEGKMRIGDLLVPRYYNAGPLSFDRERYKAYLLGENLALSETGFDLLCFLAQHMGEPLAESWLCGAACGWSEGRELTAAKEELALLTESVNAKRRGVRIERDGESLYLRMMEH